MNLELKNGAFFVADAHENEQRQGFLELLRALDGGQITTPQLIIMGDMFDMLVWQICATHEFAAPYVNLLEKLASKGIEVLYIEGNHDFNVARFFKRVKVFSLKNQPIILQSPSNLAFSWAKFGENALKFIGKASEFKGISQVKLAHGDIFLPPLLAFALKSLRCPLLLTFLNFIDKVAFGKISARILKNQKKKDLFYQIADFDTLAIQRYAKYRTNGDLVIEGHYHQNAIINTKECKYINLPTFAYERSFFVVEW